VGGQAKNPTADGLA